MSRGFDKYSKLNPFKGINRKDKLIRKKPGKSSKEYLIESWITGKEDEWHSSNAGHLRILLESYGLTCQEWYDIAVLGYTDVSQRPKCSLEGCDKDVEFSLGFGYRKYCSKLCQTKGTMTEEKCNKMHKSWKDTLTNDKDARDKFSDKQRKGRIGKKVTPETLEKIRKNAKLRKGIPLSEETKRKIGETNKKNYRENLDNIDRILDVGYHRTKSGNYKPVKCSYPIRYLSSWELEFMKICDSLDYVDKIEKGLKFRYYNSVVGDYKIYVSDFKITTKSGDIFVIEIKPKCFLKKTMVSDKRNSAIEYCKNNNMRYLMLTQYDLFLNTENGKEPNMNLDLYLEYNNQYSSGEWDYYK